MTARPALEAVIFDAGGTLVRLDFEWMAGDLAAHGFATDPEALRRAEVQGRRAYDASRGPAERWATIEGVRGDVRAYFGGMLAAAGAPPGMLGPAVDRFLERETTRGLWVHPMEGARRSLEALGRLGLRAAVVSNSDGRAERHLRNADLLRGVEFVVDSRLVGIEKPDPAIFGVALARLGTAPERTLFVGDIRSVDEAGARAAGMCYVLLDPYGDYGEPDTPRIAGLLELAGWLSETFELPRARASEGGRAAGRAARSRWGRGAARVARRGARSRAGRRRR